MLLERLKWPCEPLYLHAIRWIGEDEHGDWLAFDPGTPIWRGRRLVGHGLSAGLVLLPRHGSWVAQFPEGRDYTVAVDISTPGEWTDYGVSTVDLGLVVLRRDDGSVEEVGRDVFEAACRERCYPEELTEMATRELARIRSVMADDAEPFRSVWQDWRSKTKSA